MYHCRTACPQPGCEVVRAHAQVRQLGLDVDQAADAAVTGEARGRTGY